MNKKYLINLAIIIFVLVCWQVIETRVDAVRIAGGETSFELFLPTPRKIIYSLIQDRGLIINEMAFTLSRAMLGLAIGSIFALSIVIIFIVFPILRDLVMPLTLAINSFPIAGFAPLVILVFGQGSWIGIVFISALISYFPTLITVDYAVQSIEEELIELMNLWGANKWQVFTKVQIPHSLPSLLSAARLSIPASIIGATLGEWLGTRHGIGHLVILSFYQLKPGLMYASLISLTIVSLVLVSGIAYIEKRLFIWKS